MGSVNKVILVGNLGRDAELRYTPGGAPVATLNLATTEVWNDKSGQRQEKTEWHRVVLWGKMAETLSEYLIKGKQIYVEGRLQTRQWEAREGTLQMPSHPAALYNLFAPEPPSAAGEHPADASRLYVIYVPGGTAEEMGLPSAPAGDAPWVMFSGEPNAHVMISP